MSIAVSSRRNLVSRMIRQYGLTSGDVVPYSVRVAFALSSGLDFDALTHLLDNGVQNAILELREPDAYFVR